MVSFSQYSYRRYIISMFLVHLKTVHKIVYHLLGVLGENSKRMDLQCWMIATRMSTVYALVPVTHSYLLTGDFDGRSLWPQGCTAPQGILEQSRKATCTQVSTTCTLLAPVKAANEVCPWLWFEDLSQTLEREAAGEPPHSTHVVNGPFDMLVQMRADRYSNHFCWWRTSASVLRPSQSPRTVGYASTAESGSSSSGVQLRRASQGWVRGQTSHRGSSLTLPGLWPRTWYLPLPVVFPTRAHCQTTSVQSWTNFFYHPKSIHQSNRSVPLNFSLSSKTYSPR